MRRLRTFAASLLAVFATSAIVAAPAPPPPPPPSTMIFGGWGATGPTFELLEFPNGTEIRTKSTSIPQDGAWVWGDAHYSSYTWMDCEHHWVGELTPNNSAYIPFFMLGKTAIDAACFGMNCYSCSVNWGGTKENPGYLTDTFPAFLPAGSSQIQVRSLNGGGHYPNEDAVTFWLAQVNADQMQSMDIYMARDEDDPLPLAAEEVADRYFVGDSEDLVPVVPKFIYGNESFPHAPGTVFTALWDNGTNVNCTIQPPAAEPSLGVVRVPVPKMTTGTHTFTLKATLPSGKTYTKAMSVYVFAQPMYLDIDGGFSPTTPEDEAQLFVPGSNKDGTSVSITEAAAQQVTLWVIPAPGAIGNVQLEIVNPSTLPGIAMNYPRNNPFSTPDMDFGSGGTKSIPIPKGKKKWVSTTLYIRDYAASGSIKVTVQLRKRSYSVTRKFPRDANNNRIADAGWKALTSAANGTYVQINDTGLSGSADEDNNPAVSGPTAGLIGDGLTNLEEYRGWIVGGEHRRLNPFRKDLFVYMDDEIKPLASVFLKLPLTFHLVDRDEIFTTTVPGDPAADDIDPVANPNRDVTLGMTVQRGLRIRNRENAPLYYNSDLPGGVIEADRVFGGYDIVEGMNVHTIFAGQDPGIFSPNETHVVEYFPDIFKNGGIYFGTNGLQSRLDAAGNVVDLCTTPTQLNCDQVHPQLPLLLAGADKILQTVPTGDETYSFLHHLCAPGSIMYLTPGDMTELKKLIIGHEAGHGVDMEHVLFTDYSDPACGDLMNSPPAGYPITNDYSAQNRGEIRIHRKF